MSRLLNKEVLLTPSPERRQINTYLGCRRSSAQITSEKPISECTDRAKRRLEKLTEKRLAG